MPRPSRNVEKAKDFKGTWIKIIKYCKKYYAILLVAIVCAIAGTVMTLIGPNKIADLTDIVQKGLFGQIDMDSVANIGLTLITIYLISMVLQSLQGWIMATTTQRISQGLRSDISRKINCLPMWYYNKTSTGDVLSRVTNDVDMVGQSLNQSISTLVSAVTLFIGSLIMMFVTNWILALTAIGATAIGFLLMGAIAGKSQKYFARQQKHLGEINGLIEEIYAGHTVVKAYNGEGKSQATFDNMNSNLKDSAFKAQCMAGLMMPIMTFVGNFGYVAVCVVGAVLALDHKISIGTIIAFTMYVRYFTQPLSQMAQAFQSLQSAAKEYSSSWKLKKWRMREIKYSSSVKSKVRCSSITLSLVTRTAKELLFTTFLLSPRQDRKWQSSDLPARERRLWSTCL